ncbi:MAG TPA: 1-deoxy-D-xylulose-5-phosphate reductoisomerase [Candidatus Brocadiia bacterium]|nr:1-deoxy-D-xylulose-5-phosphate reductoisomerase [Candidatus Brocadiales bacterium]
MKNIVILGSTGSIGRNALEVIRNLGRGYKVAGLSANSRWDVLSEQIEEFRPRWAALTDESLLPKLRERVSNNEVEILAGPDSIKEIVAKDEVDIVLSAIVGAAGLPAVLEAIRCGKTLALANKEPLVMAGGIVMPMSKKNGVKILPVDSEHSAIFQALQAGKRKEVKKVILTASGGPFFKLSVEELKEVTVEQALNHPTWRMGRKITIDSATLMNKALEIIEAKWLFDLDPSQIEVLIHPQSIVHSMVEFCDSSVVAQMGMPNMKVPIQYAFTYPNRKNSRLQSLNLAKTGELTFFKAEPEKFPALRLGFEAARLGGTMGTVMNAANEVAVQAFLDGQIKFTDITTLIENVMNKHSSSASGENPTLEETMAVDKWARHEARERQKATG